MKVIIGDIETYLEFFLCSFYNPQSNEWYRFKIHRWENDLTKIVNFFENNKEYYFVFYNGLRFDTQVLEYLLRNYQYWEELSGLEISSILYQKATDIIDDSKFDVFPSYRESDLSFKTIDPFEIAHYSNKNRMVSLKRLMFEMDMENIEELPFAPDRKDLTIEEINKITDYCDNDIRSLYKFYKILRGDTDHPLYRENDQIQLRKDIEEEFGIKCLNYSDTKIGDEIIKKYYCEESGLTYEELPRKGFFRKEINVGDCIAKYIKFKTPQLKSFLTRLRGRRLTQKDDINETIKFCDNAYTFAKGGLHTANKPKMFEASSDTLIIDWDVSSYYPAIIINNKKYPHHLGKGFLVGYEKMFNMRLQLKSLSKTDRRIAGIVGALKLAVNSVYGKSSDMTSWMYDRQLTMFTTITGELSLLMLIEAYELAGIKVISANTDGVTIMISKNLIEKMTDINKWWTELTSFSLERTDYSKIVFTSVNDYIALKPNGEVKRKGDFTVDFELHKNKSGRIIPIALREWFVNHTPVVQTIRHHSCIYDFCLRQKASRFFHYEGIRDGKVTIYNKLIRYYVSNSGEKIYKIKNPECTTNAPAKSQVEAGEWVCTVANFLPKTIKVEDCDINYDFYVEKAEAIIAKVDKTYKKTKKEDRQQLSLW